MDKPVIKTILPGVELVCVRTDKFKTGHLSINLILRLDREDASKNALLPFVLRRGCTRFPNMESLAAELDQLYGASVEPLVRTVGEIQCVGLTADFADDRFLPGGERILEKVISLAGEILLDPATRGGLLRTEYVRSERDNLCDKLRSVVNDKRAYALFRLKELMCADESYSVDRLGTLQTAEKISQLALTKHYRRVIASSQIKVFYCGSADEERVTEAVLHALSTLPRTEIDRDVGTEVRVSCGEPRYVTESMDVTQGKLALGFRLGETMYAPDYAAISVFNCVFGGGVTSKLFVNVRERLSLCYYASSGIDRFKGIMVVSSGVEFDKYDTAKNEILAQLEACAKGDITDDELASAKKYLMTAVRSMTDSAFALDSFWLNQSLDGLTFGPEEYALLIGEIERETVVKVAQSVKLDMVYFLRDNGGEETK